MQVAGVAQNSICFSRRDFERGEGSALGKILGRSLHPGQSPICTIVFIPLSAAQRKLNADWAPIGRKLARRQSFAGARFARRIRSLVMDADRSKLMTNTMTGSRFGAVFADFAK